MDEIRLINMLSYLDPEILENDYIENDIRDLDKVVSFLGYNKNKLVKIIVAMFAGAAIATGVIGVIFRRKKKNKTGIKKINLPSKLIKRGMVLKHF